MMHGVAELGLPGLSNALHNYRTIHSITGLFCHLWYLLVCFWNECTIVIAMFIVSKNGLQHLNQHSILHMTRYQRTVNINDDICGKVVKVTTKGSEHHHTIG